MLAHHPEVQIKLQAEFDVVLCDRFPTSDDIQKLSYTRMTHHDSRFYEAPLLFRPERWSGLEEHALPRYAFFPSAAATASALANTSQ